MDTSNLNNNELNDKLKELKKQATTHAFMLGLAIGIICYSFFVNGIRLKPSTIFPLLLLLGITHLIKRNNSMKKKVKSEIELRRK